jgi:ribulose 1,5-bisphosphate carboxylase large subunit-like protein
MFTILLLGTGSVVVSTAWLVGLTGLKLYTYIRMHHLRLPIEWKSIWQPPPEAGMTVRELVKPVR